MGLWDHIKPVSKPPSLASLERREDRLRLGWDDQVQTEIGFHELRVQCPCAACVEEWTGRRTVDPGAIPADVHPLEVHPIGNYAVSIVWSDGHTTGIYSWKTLRGLGSAVT